MGCALNLGTAVSFFSLTVREVADALQVCRATVYRIVVAQGEFPSVRVSNAIRVRHTSPA